MTSRLSSRRLGIRTFLAFGVFVALFLANNPADAFRKDVSSFTLKNGLQVVVIPDRRAAVVTHMIWYKVGSADEAPGETGLAHFLEHLLFKGTAKRKPGEFSRVVARHGGSDNAFTSLDYTAYFQRVARSKLPLVMEMEADRMTNLRLTDAVVLPERKVVREERRSRVDNHPGSRLAEQMNAAFYVSHPYGSPVIGWMHEIKALDRQKALAFYKKYYAPNNAILIVAGDVSEAELRPLAEKFYSAIPANPNLPKRRIRPREPEPQAARRVILRDPRVANPLMRRAYLAPSYTTAQPGEAEALEVFAAVVGGNATSLLFQDLVVKQKIATTVGMSYTGDGLDSGRLSVYAVPGAGKNLPETERALDKALAGILANGFDDAELKRAKTGLIAEAIYSQDSQTRLARIYGTSLAVGETLQDVAEWPKRIEAVTKEQVMAVARKYLTEKRSTTGYLLKANK